MNRISSFLACSILVAAPALTMAQGNSGQMHGGGMMDQERMEQMQQNMSQMQAMMQEMRNAKSPEERQEIRQKHMESMQEHMGMMGGQGMMKNQGKKQSGGAGMDSEQRLEMMENRMDQMQMMMEQMLEHQRQTSGN